MTRENQMSTDTAQAETTQVTGTPPAVTADAASLIRALANGALFASTDATLPAICCLHLTVKDGTLTVEATDKYVASQETLPCTGTLEVLVSAKDTLAAVKPLTAAIKASAKLCGYMAEQPAVTVTLDGAWVRFTLTGHLAPDLSATVAASNAEFPRRTGKMMDDAEARDGEDSAGHATFTAANLLRLAKVADSADLAAKYRPVRFAFGGNNKPAVARIGDTFRALIMPYGKG